MRKDIEVLDACPTRATALRQHRDPGAPPARLRALSNLYPYFECTFTTIVGYENVFY